MSFEYNPADEDEHALCRHEIETLRAVNAELLAALVSFRNLARLAAEKWDADEYARVGKLLLAMSGFRPGYRADIDAIHEMIAKAKGVK